jgi:transposase-like protein
MARVQRAYSVEFKRAVVQQYLEGGLSPNAIARQHRLSRTLIGYWTKKFVAGELEGPVARDLEHRELQARVALLERKVGQLVLENELLKKTLPRSRSLNAASCSIVSGPGRSACDKDAD